MSRPICPSFDDTCPYFHRGKCMMLPMTGDSPESQCDEYNSYDVEEEEEK